MRNPYPGLRPFRADETALFSGRELIAESVTTRVRIAPLTVMFARSGVGKSSFLNCRLVPHLADESAVVYLNEWGSDSPEQLIDRKLSALFEAPEGPERPVLVLDQFEDVFKSATSRHSLWDSLASIANVSDAPAHLLISMREEWLGAWQEAEDYLPDAPNCLLRLRPLADREVLSAIIDPARREGSTSVDPKLARVLVDDMNRPSAFGLEGSVVEPGLVQLVCRRLWSEAQRRNLPTITIDLYDELGRGDMIIREFVWNELGSAGMKDKEIADQERPTSRFTTSDRVLWSGLTRQLIVAHGIKSIVSADGLAQRLRIEDMGLTGRAVAEKEVQRADMEYLDTVPEQRGLPSRQLVGWIEGVLQAAVDVGFMKRQRQLLQRVEADRNSSNVGAGSTPYIYELSHDALADILQVFKIEFEGWIRLKMAKLVGTIVGALIVLPGVLFVLLTASWTQFVSTIVTLIGLVLLGALYIGVVWVLSKLMTRLVRLIMHPIYRRFARGRVPIGRIPRTRRALTILPDRRD